MTKLVVATGFIVAFCAGIMVGLLSHRPAAGQAGAAGPGGRASWIAGQLNLSPDQQAKMREIWEGVSHHGGHDQGSRRAQVRREQDEAVAQLVRPDDRAAYERVLKDGRDKMDAIEGDNRRAFQQAVEKTKLVLTAEQLTKYEALLAKPTEGRPTTRPGEGGADHAKERSKEDSK